MAKNVPAHMSERKRELEGQRKEGTKEGRERERSMIILLMEVSYFAKEILLKVQAAACRKAFKSKR